MQTIQLGGDDWRLIPLPSGHFESQQSVFGRYTVVYYWILIERSAIKVYALLVKIGLGITTKNLTTGVVDLIATPIDFEFTPPGFKPPLVFVMLTS